MTMSTKPEALSAGPDALAGHCPRCKRRNYDVFETVEVVDYHEVRNGVKVFSDPGTPVRTTQTRGRCADCQHEWRFRRPHDWCSRPSAEASPRSEMPS